MADIALATLLFALGLLLLFLLLNDREIACAQANGVRTKREIGSTGRP